MDCRSHNLTSSQSKEWDGPRPWRRPSLNPWAPHSYVSYITCETYENLTLLTSYPIVLLFPDINILTCKQAILAMMSGLASKSILIVEQCVVRLCHILDFGILRAELERSLVSGRLICWPDSTSKGPNWVGNQLSLVMSCFFQLCHLPHYNLSQVGHIGVWHRTFSVPVGHSSTLASTILFAQSCTIKKADLNSCRTLGKE